MVFQSFIRWSLLTRIVAPSHVNLIPGASQAVVLSDVGTDAASRAGELRAILAGWDTNDRDPTGAMRPATDCLDRKSFSPAFISAAAKLFTGTCGDFLLGLLLTLRGLLASHHSLSPKKIPSSPLATLRASLIKRNKKIGERWVSSCFLEELSLLLSSSSLLGKCKFYCSCCLFKGNYFVLLDLIYGIENPL